MFTTETAKLAKAKAKGRGKGKIDRLTKEILSKFYKGLLKEEEPGHKLLLNNGKTLRAFYLVIAEKAIPKEVEQGAIITKIIVEDSGNCQPILIEELTG